MLYEFVFGVQVNCSCEDLQNYFAVDGRPSMLAFLFVHDNFCASQISLSASRDQESSDLRPCDSCNIMFRTHCLQCMCYIDISIVEKELPCFSLRMRVLISNYPNVMNMSNFEAQKAIGAIGSALQKEPGGRKAPD